MRKVFSGTKNRGIPETWETFLETSLPLSVILCVPSILHLVGFSNSGIILFVIMAILIGIDFILGLFRFIKATSEGRGRVYKTIYFEEWLMYGISLFVGTVVSKLVGLL